MPLFNYNGSMLGNYKISIPEYALKALSSLEQRGYEAWFVGGCVRDALLGRLTNDYDITTSAPWTDTERILISDGFAVHRTGAKHGTVTASIDGHALEITTYRIDGNYSDGRHPDQATFVSNIKDDLARRDFSVNALAYHPDRGLLDCWNGIEDLTRGLLRTVGDPAQRFREDGLRILRGCRFASQLGFNIENETLQAMKAHKMMLDKVSAERITHEMDGLLLGDFAHDSLMETVDILSAIMPEIAACKGFDQHTPYHIYDVWEHTAWVVQRAPKTRLARWTALFHDIGKPGACFFEGTRAHFYGHARLSTLLARPIMERLSMAPAFIDKVITLIGIHDDQIPPTSRAVRRALAKLNGDVELFQALIGVKRADALAQSDLGKPRVKLADDLAYILSQVLEDELAFTIRQLAINGRDVMELGIAEGPAIGMMLEHALEAVIDGKADNERDALLAYLRQETETL